MKLVDSQVNSFFTLFYFKHTRVTYKYIESLKKKKKMFYGIDQLIKSKRLERPEFM